MSNTTLTADLDCSAYNGTALFMGKHRLVLDLNGFTIWGYTGSDSNSGVDTNGRNHTVVKNGTIANFHYGVYVNGSYNTKIRKLDIVGEAADSNDYGVYAHNHVATLVRKVDISGVQTGVYLEYGSNALVTESMIAADNDGTAIYPYYEAKGTFSWNTLMGDYYGVYDYYGSGNRYTGNTANNGVYGFTINCYSEGRVFLTGNTANDNDNDGFYVYECYHDHDGWAPGTGSQISGNTAIGNGGTGFYDYYSINATWTNNVAKWNDSVGFYLDYPAAVTMTGNVGSRNGSDGFYFYENYGSYNLAKFSKNKANWNSGYGMYGSYGVPGKGNTARNNSSSNCYNVLCNVN